MNRNLKIPSPGAQLAVFLGLLGGSLILASVTILLLPGIHAGQIPGDPGTLKLVQTLTSIILFGLPSFAYALLTFREHPLASLGFRPAVKNYFYLLTILLLVFSFPLEGWLAILNKKIALPHWMTVMEDTNDKQITALLQTKTSMDLVVNLLVIAIIPGIFEEICFRGVLQRIMIQIFKSPWTGIVVTGILFSAFHMQFAGFLPRAFLGILLGAAFWYSGSLWTVILAHAFYNGIQVLAVGWYPQLITENPSVPTYSALASLVIVVGLLTFMRRRSTVTYAQVYGT